MASCYLYGCQMKDKVWLLSIFTTLTAHISAHRYCSSNFQSSAESWDNFGQFDINWVIVGWVERSSKQACPKMSKKQAETQVVRLQKSLFLRNLLYFGLGSTYNNPIYVKLTEIISAFSRTLKIWAMTSVSWYIHHQSCKDN